MKRGSNQTTAPGAKSPRTRLYVTDDLGPGQIAVLDRQRAHYLRDVLRLQPGAAVRLFNGRDGEWKAHIAALSKSQAHIEMDSQTRPQAPEPGPTLLFAPVKRTAIDLIAEKATELGAATLQPVMTKFTDVSRVNLERLRAIAIEASEQCERLTVPDLLAPTDLAIWLGERNAAQRLLVCAERLDDGQTLAQAAVDLPCDDQPAILVGPEGGFREDEIALLSNAENASLVSLGPLVLRAETASLAALAVLGASRA